MPEIGLLGIAVYKVAASISSIVGKNGKLIGLIALCIVGRLPHQGARVEPIGGVTSRRRSNTRRDTVATLVRMQKDSVQASSFRDAGSLNPDAVDSIPDTP